MKTDDAGRWTRPLRHATLPLVALLLAACAGPNGGIALRALGPGERWLRVADIADVCRGTGLVDATIHGSPDDPRLVWVEFRDGSRKEVAWPAGFSARFTPTLEVLDAIGRVVGVEGTEAIGQCPAKDHAMLVDLGPLRPAPSPSG
ncbi:MAG: hypothetical protein U0869_07855 [Chloroflexota bacterium]